MKSLLREGDTVYYILVNGKWVIRPEVISWGEPTSDVTLSFLSSEDAYNFRMALLNVPVI